MPDKEPVWYKVLSTYKGYGGMGLSPHALVHITGIPWTALRVELIERRKTNRDVASYRCGTLKAELITSMLHGPFDLEKLDKWISRYKSKKWQGIDDGKGQIKLRVYGGDRVLTKLYEVVENHGKPEEATKPAK